MYIPEKELQWKICSSKVEAIVPMFISGEKTCKLEFRVQVKLTRL